MSNAVIATNIQALNSNRLLKSVSLRSEKSSARLSSGLKINSAGDDAAGLAISETMRSQIRGLDMASKNSQDGISVLQIADGALSEIGNMIQRIRELNVQGANDTNTFDDRKKMSDEIFQLTNEIRGMEDKVEFNGKKILKTINGTPGSGTHNPDSIDGMFLQIGANADQSMVLSLSIDELNSNSPYDLTKVSFLYSIASYLNHSGLALIGAYGDNHVAGTSYNYSGDDTLNPSLSYIVNGGEGGLTNSQWISARISNVDSAYRHVNIVRSTIGAAQNRLEHTMKSLEVSSVNTSTAESRIRDADMAKEMMELSKAGVLSQAAMSMLAQANQTPNMVLSLLR